MINKYKKNKTVKAIKSCKKSSLAQLFLTFSASLLVSHSTHLIKLTNRKAQQAGGVRTISTFCRSQHLHIISKATIHLWICRTKALFYKLFCYKPSSWQVPFILKVEGLFHALIILGMLQWSTSRGLMHMQLVTHNARGDTHYCGSREIAGLWNTASINYFSLLSK